MPARPLFIGGTSSNAGKSWMTTAICAWLHRRGVRVAPFKAQTMSNHSYPCRGGGEIGRAQVAQAEACGLEPEPAMNPILLKPNGNGTSQVVLHGRVWKTLAPRDYYAAFDVLIGEVLAAYADLARRFDVVVIEGAGSVSELNLRAHDLVNLGLVTRLGAPWVLVADIERGGVIASVAGTVALLTPDERRAVPRLPDQQVPRRPDAVRRRPRASSKQHTGAPCLGVFPYAEDVRVDAEDSLAVDRRPRRRGAGGRGDRNRAAAADVERHRLPSAGLGGLADGAAAGRTPLRLRGAARHQGHARRPRLARAAGPGRVGACPARRRRHRSSASAAAIRCSARRIADPDAVESTGGVADGLGLLPVRTVLAAEKRTRVVRATTAGGASCPAYEIHMGVTTVPAEVPPFAVLDDG